MAESYNYDLVIRNARVRSVPNGRFDIAIKDGLIAEINEHISGKGGREINAEGNLVTEAFVNPHLHMCKVYTFLMLGEESVRYYHSSDMGGAMTAIELAAKIKEKYHEGWIYENVKKAAIEAIKHGTLYIRAFVDTDTKGKLEGVKALLRLRDEMKDVLNIQVVAFPQDGVIRDPGAEEYIRKAMELGADVVGGIPWIEYTVEDEEKHINIMFEIAKEFNKDVAMLTDDAGDPGLRTTEILARKAIKDNWVGRVTACHARAMQLYPEPYLRKLTALIKKAEMSLVSDPHTGPLHLPIKFMLDSGVNVALGQDDIADAYYPYGANNMLEVAFLNSHILWMTTLNDMDTLFDMITWRAAKAMNIDRYGLKVGNRADIVILDGKSVYEAIWKHKPPKYVISKGKLVAVNEEESKLIF